MNEFKSQHEDEIDLIELFINIWQRKWVILSIILICILGVFGFKSISPFPSFTATTEIKKINTVETNYYDALNSLEFFNVTPSLLLNLYIEQIEDRKLFIDAFTKLNVLNRSDFDTDEDYNSAIMKMGHAVAITPPNVSESKKNEKSRPYWQIKFKYADEDVWKAILFEVHANATIKVMNIVNELFETDYSVAKMKRDFFIDDLNLKIQNLLDDYDREVVDKLAFLHEQALISHELGIAKNTIESQMFNTQTGVLASLKSDSPFYLKGYEAIEKEISLIGNRTNKSPFIKGLLEKEKELRGFEQDKQLDRVKQIFNSTPAKDITQFKAVHVEIDATNFKYNNKLILWLSLAILIGGMIGVVYVVISSSIQKRRV